MEAGSAISAPSRTKPQPPATSRGALRPASAGARRGNWYVAGANGWSCSPRQGEPHAASLQSASAGEEAEAARELVPQQPPGSQRAGARTPSARQRVGLLQPCKGPNDKPSLVTVQSHGADTSGLYDPVRRAQAAGPGKMTSTTPRRELGTESAVPGADLRRLANGAPLAARLYDTVVAIETEGLGECLQICAQKSRPLRLLGFQHLHRDTRLQKSIEAKAGDLACSVLDTLLLAKVLFFWHESSKRDYVQQQFMDQHKLWQSEQKVVRARLRDRAVDAAVAGRCRALVLSCLRAWREHRLKKERCMSQALSFIARQDDILQSLYLTLWRQHRCLSAEHAELMGCAKQRLLAALDRSCDAAMEALAGSCLKGWRDTAGRAAASKKRRHEGAVRASRWIAGHESMLRRASLTSWVLAVRQAKSSLARALSAVDGSARAWRYHCLASWSQVARDAARERRLQAVRREGALAANRRVLEHKLSARAWLERANFARCFRNWCDTCKSGRFVAAKKQLSMQRTIREIAKSEQVLLVQCLMPWAHAARSTKQERLAEQALKGGQACCRQKLLGAVSRSFHSSDQAALLVVFHAWDSVLRSARAAERHKQHGATIVRRAVKYWSDAAGAQCYAAWAWRATHRRVAGKQQVAALKLLFAASRETSLCACITSWACCVVASGLQRARRREATERLVGVVAAGHDALQSQCLFGWARTARQARVSRLLVLRDADKLEATASAALQQASFIAWSLFGRCSSQQRKLAHAYEELQAVNLSVNEAKMAAVFDALADKDVYLLVGCFRVWEKGKDESKHQRTSHSVKQSCAERMLRSMRRAIDPPDHVLRDAALVAWRDTVGAARLARKAKQQRMDCARCLISGSEDRWLCQCLLGWSRSALQARQLRLERGARQKTYLASVRAQKSADLVLACECAEMWRQFATAASSRRRRRREKIAHTLKHIAGEEQAMLQSCSASWSAATLRSRRVTAAALRKVAGLDWARQRVCLSAWHHSCTAGSYERSLQDAQRRGELARQRELATMAESFKLSDHMFVLLCLNAWSGRAYWARWSNKGLARALYVMGEVGNAKLMHSILAWARVAKAAREKRVTSMAHSKTMAAMGLSFDVLGRALAFACFCEWRRAKDLARFFGTRRAQQLACTTRMLTYLDKMLLSKCISCWACARGAGQLRRFRGKTKARAMAMGQRAGLLSGRPLLAQCLASWRLSACLQMQASGDLKLLRSCTWRGRTYAIMLRGRLAEQRHFYRWWLCCRLKDTLPVPPLEKKTMPQFTQPLFHLGPGQSRSTKFPISHVPSVRSQARTRSITDADRHNDVPDGDDCTLDKVFDRLDTDKDGVLSRGEFRSNVMVAVTGQELCGVDRYRLATTAAVCDRDYVTLLNHNRRELNISMVD